MPRRGSACACTTGPGALLFVLCKAGDSGAGGLMHDQHGLDPGKQLALLFFFFFFFLSFFLFFFSLFPLLCLGLNPRS